MSKTAVSPQIVHNIARALGNAQIKNCFPKGDGWDVTVTGYTFTQQQIDDARAMGANGIVLMSDDNGRVRMMLSVS